jgi:hypothetical protein
MKTIKWSALRGRKKPYNTLSYTLYGFKTYSLRAWNCRIWKDWVSYYLGISKMELWGITKFWRRISSIYCILIYLSFSWYETSKTSSEKMWFNTSNYRIWVWKIESRGNIKGLWPIKICWLFKKLSIKIHKLHRQFRSKLQKNHHKRVTRIESVVSRILLNINDW